MPNDIIILGIFVADTSYRADRQPRMGETILGNKFTLGPGGKGSNQAVAAAKSGGNVGIITKLGKDAFADMALGIWSDAGVTSLATQHDESYTGAAYIFVEESTGNNAIIVAPGIAATISSDDVQKHTADIATAKVFVTQLEQPIDAAMTGLQLARAAGVKTILNPAPVAEISDKMLSLCDYVTPNETEAEGLTGITVSTPQDAERAAKAILSRGAGAAIITLGENGALYHDGIDTLHVPAITAGPVIETTGAGDAFNGGFATALSQGMPALSAVKFANAAAAISVTRPGTAPAMPDRAEIDALVKIDANHAK
ncbi:ribokinase [Parasulfitobacter algicola]|uniref:Ribokinase n=1 Tax=Parasulfitobacter algicola TaxID=2614809 RepID=A0ABX2IUT1_9RHOB|nr:ribokinase [Sulfitobacter algicola]NSX56658.1 ribokinase [Sulfitobacter algicola]